MRPLSFIFPCDGKRGQQKRVCLHLTGETRAAGLLHLEGAGFLVFGIVDPWRADPLVELGTVQLQQNHP